MKQIVGFVTQCFNKYVYVIISNTNLDIIVKFIKDKKWKLKKKQSIGCPVYLVKHSIVMHM